jgi:HSP20 family protein
MPITRWEPFQELEHWEPFREPFRELDRIQRQMNRLFDRLGPMDKGERAPLDFIPAAEMTESADTVQLKLEIPGLEAKDLTVEVTEDSVSISGERKSETETEENGVVRSEFRYGKFQRMMSLPVHVQNDKVQAEYKNGILLLTLPKVAGEQKKAVKIDIS